MGRDIRHIELPSSWADPPEFMSFSALGSIEACPLRWALSNADYSEFWSGRGYPSKTGLSSITGQVIHRVAESVLRGANSLSDGSFSSRMIAAVRAAGGLTTLINQSLDDILANYANNPRMVQLIDQYQSGRLTLPPTVRTSLQTLLNKISRHTPAVESEKIVKSERHRNKSTALPFGVFTELKLYATDKAWYGKLDLLSIGPNEVAIEDIKTGKPKDMDREQVYVYSWLWWRDQRRNPRTRLPTKLTLRYLDSSVDVPVLCETDLEQFEVDLLGRTARALTSISEGERKAHPDPDICRYCDVRQMCEDYWQEIVANDVTDVDGFGDVEAKLVGILSPKTWQVEVIAGSIWSTGTRALLRGNFPDGLAENGSVIRILGAAFVEPSEDETSEGIPIVQMRAYSEFFVIPQQAGCD